MPHSVKGVIAKSKGEPVSVEIIEIPDPGPGEVLVDVKACGVCHTDLHFREGAINDEFPFLLGHEAAGIVEEVGEGVVNVSLAISLSGTGELFVGNVVLVNVDVLGIALILITPHRKWLLMEPL